MECFGNYKSDNSRCYDCWLRECCKLVRNQQEMDLLASIKNDAIVLRRFDGSTLSEQKIGYNRSLKEFLQAH
jgi:hypothetical protein